MNNTWMTNCPLWQGGAMTFRYAITSARDLPPAGERVEFGRSFVEGLDAIVAASTHSTRKLRLTAGQARLEIPHQRLSVEAMETSRDGRSVRLYLIERSGRRGICQIGLPTLSARAARRIDLRGQPSDNKSCHLRSPHVIDLALAPHELAVIELELN
jgi:hypothetical protein